MVIYSTARNFKDNNVLKTNGNSSCFKTNMGIIILVSGVQIPQPPPFPFLFKNRYVGCKRSHQTPAQNCTIQRARSCDLTSWNHLIVDSRIVRVGGLHA